MKSMFSFTADKGLSNQTGHNNCFLNSAVQVFWHLQVFRRNFLAMKHHGCVEGSCIYCALQEIFQELQSSYNDVIDPDMLRVTLAVTFEDQMKFQLGELDDASECYEKILSRVHFHLTDASSDDFCSHKHCITHQKFAMSLIEQSKCQCSATSEPLVFTQLVHYISTSAIIKCSQDPSYDGDFSHCLRGAYEQEVQASSCPQGCPLKTTLIRTLLTQPDVVTIGLVWNSETSELTHIRDFVSCIKNEIFLHKLFYCPEMETMNSRRELVGVVCYYMKHYSTFFKRSLDGLWISFDDGSVSEIGHEWNKVVDKVVKGRYQPLLLIFQNPDAKPIHTSTAPTRTYFIKKEYTPTSAREMKDSDKRGVLMAGKLNPLNQPFENSSKNYNNTNNSDDNCNDNNNNYNNNNYNNSNYNNNNYNNNNYNNNNYNNNNYNNNNNNNNTSDNNDYTSKNNTYNGTLRAVKLGTNQVSINNPLFHSSTPTSLPSNKLPPPKSLHSPEEDLSRLEMMHVRDLDIKLRSNDLQQKVLQKRVQNNQPSNHYHTINPSSNQLAIQPSNFNLQTNPSTNYNQAINQLQLDRPYNIHNQFQGHFNHTNHLPPLSHTLPRSLPNTHRLLALPHPHPFNLNNTHNNNIHNNYNNNHNNYINNNHIHDNNNIYDNNNNNNMQYNTLPITHLPTHFTTTYDLNHPSHQATPRHQPPATGFTKSFTHHLIDHPGQLKEQTIPIHICNDHKSNPANNSNQGNSYSSNQGNSYNHSNNSNINHNNNSNTNHNSNSNINPNNNSNNSHSNTSDSNHSNSNPSSYSNNADLMNFHDANPHLNNFKKHIGALYKQ